MERETQYSIGYSAGYKDAISDMGEWIDVRFRLPEINDPVLVYVPGSEFKIGIDELMDYNEPFKGFRYAGVTHWRKLPTYP